MVGWQAADVRLQQLLTELQITEIIEHLRDYIYFQQAAGINQGDVSCVRLIIIHFEKLKANVGST